MSAEALTASRQAISHAKAAMPQGAEGYVPALEEATKALERALNVSNPRGCARATAAPFFFSPLALRGRDGNETHLPDEDVVDLGRHGLLARSINNGTFVSGTQATLARSAAGLQIVAQGRGPTAVVSARGTIRLEKKGDVADVSVGDTIVLRPDAPEGVDKEEFELIEVMDVEAPAAAPELVQSSAAVADAEALASGAQLMAAPQRDATVEVPGLALASTLAAAVERNSGPATRRGQSRSEPPPSPLDGRSPMKEVGDALPDQSVKKGRAAKGAVQTVAKKMTPVEDRRAAEQRHRKVPAVLLELERYHLTAPEASVEAALEENDDNAYAAANCMIRRMKEFSVRRI